MTFVFFALSHGACCKISYSTLRYDCPTLPTPTCANRESENMLMSEHHIKRTSCLQSCKVVLLEDLGSHFGMRTQDAIARLQDLLAEGTLTG